MARKSFSVLFFIKKGKLLKNGEAWKSHKQVQFVREIMQNASPCQPAGFGNFRKTRFLIVHLHKNFKCVFQHFIPVSYHITYRFYIFGVRKYYFIPIRTTL